MCNPSRGVTKSKVYKHFPIHIYTMVDGLNTLVQSLEKEGFDRIELILTDLREIKGDLVEFGIRIFEDLREFEPPVRLGTVYNRPRESNFTDPAVRAWKAANNAYFGDWSKDYPNILYALSDTEIQDYGQNIPTAMALLANAMITAAAIDPRIKGESASKLEIVGFGIDEHFDPIPVNLPRLQEVYRISHGFYRPRLVGDVKPQKTGEYRRV